VTDVPLLSNKAQKKPHLETDRGTCVREILKNGDFKGNRGTCDHVDSFWAAILARRVITESHVQTDRSTLPLSIAYCPIHS